MATGFKNGAITVDNTTTTISNIGLGTPTGTGNVVLDNSPTLITPVLGTPTSGTLTNCTSLPSASINSATVNSYTPTLGDGSTNFTMTTQAGAYWQLGGKTFFWAHVDWSSKNGVTAAIQMSLPVNFTAADAIGFSIGYASGMPSGGFIMANGFTSQQFISFHKIVTGTTSNLTAADLATGGGLYVSGWYY